MTTRYQQGKIYKIVSTLTDSIYVGSTTEPTLARRLANHRGNHRSWLAGNSGYMSSYELLELADYSIVLLETYPCDSKDELCAREQHYIDMYRDVCVNRNKAYTGLTREEYKAQCYEANKNVILERQRIYRAANRDVVLEQKRVYREVNNAKIAAVNNVNHVCECGGRYTHINKAKHVRTKKHQAHLIYRQSLVDRITEKYCGYEDWTETGSIADMLEALED